MYELTPNINRKRFCLEPFRDAIVAGQKILSVPQDSTRGVERITWRQLEISNDLIRYSQSFACCSVIALMQTKIHRHLGSLGRQDKSRIALTM